MRKDLNINRYVLDFFVVPLYQLRKVHRKSPNTGQTLIEILVVVGLLAVFLPALMVGLDATRGGKVRQSLRLQAMAILKEGVEAVRSVREQGWSGIGNLSTASDYHPLVVGSAWTLPINSEPIDGVFTRKINIGDIYRDTNGNITANTTPPNVLDPSTKKITVTVSWNDPLPYSVSSALYITRYLSNGAFLYSTTAHFNDPNAVRSSIKVTDSAGDGSISLGSADTGRSDWCVPNVLSNKLNLSKNGAARSIWANPFEAFVGLGLTTANPSMVKVTMSDTTPPTQPTLTQAGIFDTGYSTNQVFGVGNFTYLATTNNNKEIVIAQKVGANFNEVGVFNASGNDDADSVFVVGTRGFMTQANNLRVFNANSPFTQLGTATFGTITNITGKVFVRGNFAYIAIQGDTRKMEIFDVTTNTPVKVAWATINGGTAQDIFVNPDGDRAYMATNFDSSLPEFFIIDTTNKSLPLHQLPAPIGSYNTLNSMSPTGVEIVLADYRAILVGSAGEEYTVLSLLNESAPVRCGGVDIGQTIYDISAVKEPDGDVYAYLTTSRTASDDFEFRMVEGGPGPLLAPSGTFESAPQTFAASAALNRFKATFDQPVGTTIKFRVAVANVVAGNCIHNQYTFLGPAGTTGPTDYFQTASTGTNLILNGTIPFLTSGNYLNPGRCFKYQVTLNPNAALTVSPVLKDFTLTYAP